MATTDSLSFTNLEGLVAHLRNSDKKNTLLYAHNGTGKTRLSVAFKNAGKVNDDTDTLYFNAFTEDLFSWNNDLEHDTNRELKFNLNSRFFEGLEGLDMDNKIRLLLHRYVDFDFELNFNEGKATFSRNVIIDNNQERIDNIKVSRGEENIFIWCFFLAIAQLALDAKEEADAYSWVKYIYIDDPISSLDDNNAIAVAGHLSKMLKTSENKIKTIISTHHGLFFNVMHNELGTNAPKYFLNKNSLVDEYILTDTKDTPFFHHVSLIKELNYVVEHGTLYTYHFNILRNILEKTAAFHGFNRFDACIKQADNDPDAIIHSRIINILSHGNYSLFDPVEMQEENREYFKKILRDFMNNYRFNPDLFVYEAIQTEPA
jgi:wobble nucleotide-excising tRNase